DMGGTTAKASLIKDGEPTMAPGYYVGGYASGHPVMVPVIDVIEVGAGGGSIAWIDDVGALKVGPQSAGADPGPICYPGGGAEPTITDANLALGRLDAEDFLGGQMRLDAQGALRGIKEKIAAPLKLSVVAAAQAIVDIAISKMSLAVREVSVAKGYDPRDFALVASGGGTEPTITDANLALGRLDAEDFLGGQMRLDAQGALRGIKEKIAAPLKLSVVAAAQAIVDIAISKMSLAVREVSVAKGYDPRDFALVASGGAGPLHVVAIARELHIPTVVVPLFPAHFSALGMLSADERHDFIRTFYADLKEVDFAKLRAVCAEMLKEAQAGLRRRKDVEQQLQFDLRYVGQEFTLSVPVSPKQLESADRDAVRKAFDRLYEHRYAHHSPEEPVEIVNIRLAVIGKRPTLRFPRLAKGTRASPASTQRVVFPGSERALACPVYQREALRAGARFSGPALVREHGTTTVLFKGDTCTVAKTGELVISVKGAA
ncbi:MAG TPA: hydantoinase/oxoprolinase family protein, partial [Caldimonas sp.]|nr:hydantoinase/oxoprolinase family protein [Caldimonas sp.]